MPHRSDDYLSHAAQSTSARPIASVQHAQHVALQYAQIYLEDDEGGYDFDRFSGHILTVYRRSRYSPSVSSAASHCDCGRRASLRAHCAALFTCAHAQREPQRRTDVPPLSAPPTPPCRPASVLWLRRRWRCLRLSVRLIDPNESATRPCDSSRTDCGSQRRVLRAAKLHHAVLVVRVPARPPRARSAVSFLTSIRLCNTSVFSAAAHRPDSTTVTTCAAHRAMRSVQRCTGLSCHQRCGLPRSASKRSLSAAVTRAFNGTVDRTVFEDCHSPADQSLSTFR